MLHAIPESPKQLQIAYMVKKGWPWMAVFNDLIHRFNEAGLLQKWHKETQDAIITHERIARRNSEVALRVLNVADLQTAFYILAIGHGCGFLVFLYELLVWSLYAEIIKQ